MASNMTINYQFLNFSPQPRSHYRVPTKITQTDLSTWMPYWTLKLHKYSHHGLPSLPNQLLLQCFLFLWVFPQSSLVPEFGSMTLSSPLPQTLLIQAPNCIQNNLIFPTSCTLIQHSKVQVWWLSHQKFSSSWAFGKFLISHMLFPFLQSLHISSLFSGNILCSLPCQANPTNPLKLNSAFLLLSLSLHGLTIYLPIIMTGILLPQSSLQGI